MQCRLRGPLVAAAVVSAVLAACGTGGYSGAEPAEGDGSTNRDAGDAAGADSEFFERTYGDAELERSTPMERCLASDPSDTPEGVEAGLEMDMEEFCTALHDADPDEFDVWYGDGEASLESGGPDSDLDNESAPDLPAKPEPGAEAAYVAAVDAESQAVYDAFPRLRDSFTDKDLAQIGFANCAQMGAFTLDEIFMKAYEETGIAQDEDPDFLIANFVWSTILNAPAKLCPEHEDAVEKWKASSH